MSGIARVASRRLAVAKPFRPTALSDESTSSSNIPYPVVATLSAAGFIETTYLTLSKYLDSPVACPSNGCDAVLDSSYAELFGIPLSLFGALTYGSVALVAASAWNHSKADRNEQLNLTDTVLLSGSSLLAACSSFLVFLLATEFKSDVCVWCYLSASLSFSLLGTVAWGLGEELKKATLPGASAFLVGIAVLYIGNSLGGSSSARQIEELPYYKPDIETTSSSKAVELAEKLQKAGAKMYGAFWCSHCYEQKNTFGKEAMKSFPYVECFPEGWRKGASVIKACSDAEVRAFPTWKINGQTIEGEMTLEAIEEALMKQGSVAEIKS